MVDICRRLERPPETPQAEDQTTGRTLTRNRATRIIRIGGEDLDEELLIDRVVDIEVQETARGLPTAKLVILNDGLKFTDTALFSGNSVDVEIFTGWNSTKLVSRGKFKATVPKYAFRNASMPTIVLHCFGEVWALMVSEERRTYENLRDSDIAAQIARRHRLEADIQRTSPRYEHVAQLAMTDAEFLENRALLYGYDFYIEEGVLHFHEPRFEHSDLSLFYGGGETGVLSYFDVVVDPWVTGSLWTKAGIDRKTLQEYEIKSSDASDKVASQIKKLAGKDFVPAGQIATVNSVRPQRFLIGEGHEQSEDEARQQVQGFLKASEWIVQGSGEVLGIEILKARQVVSIFGLGHLSGDYYLTKVSHKLSASTPYTTCFEAVRPGTGQLDELESTRQRDDVTSNSSTVGTAIVA